MPLDPSTLGLRRILMENNREYPQSHEEREVQTLMERIEKKEASQEVAREAETKRMPDDFRKTV
jgi:hypothetical protein